MAFLLSLSSSSVAAFLSRCYLTLTWHHNVLMAIVQKIAFQKMKNKTFLPQFSNIASGMSKQSSQLPQCVARVYSDLPRRETSFHRIRKKPAFKKLSEIKLLQSSKHYSFFPSGQVKNEGFIMPMFTE